MNYSRYLMATAAVSLAFGVAGCSHNGGTSGGPNGGGLSLTEGNVVADRPADPDQPGVDPNTAAYRLGEGETLAATEATNSMAEAENGKAKNKSGTFKIAKNGSGGLDMTVNGQTVSFDPASEQDAEFDDDAKRLVNGNSSLYSYNGSTPGDILDGTDDSYLQVWGYETEKDGKATKGYAVVGAETPTSKIDGLASEVAASATYSGEARVEMAASDDPDEQVHVKGDLAMTANFTDRKISGEITNLQGRFIDGDVGDVTGWRNELNGGKINMTPATISGNGFSGGHLEYANDPEFEDAVTNGASVDIAGSTYSGRFYGPNAEQVGGVINVKGTATSDEGTANVIGIGAFGGSKTP